MHPFLRLTAGLSVAAVLAACGSTVPLSQQVAGTSDSLGGVPSAAAGTTGAAALGSTGGTGLAGTTGYVNGGTGASGSAAVVPTAGPSLPGTNDLSGVAGGTKP